MNNGLITLPSPPRSSRHKFAKGERVRIVRGPFAAMRPSHWPNGVPARDQTFCPLQPISARASKGCVVVAGAHAIAITRATAPSILPLAFFLSSFLLPAGSVVIVELAMFQLSTGFNPCLSLRSKIRPSTSRKAGDIDLYPWPNSRNFSAISASENPAFKSHGRR